VKFTLPLLFVLVSTIPLSAGEFRVGFGEVDVTPKLDPKKPVFLAGFGQNRKATAVHDPIMAKAVVFADGDAKVAIVCVDVVGLFQPTVARVRAKLPGFQAVTVSSTHNHEGPDTMGIWGPNPFTSGVDPAYLASLEAGVVEAVQIATKSLQPAKAVIGKSKAPELLNDTRDPIVLHDEIVALRFEDAKGKNVGLVVQWNCHPETLSSGNTAISADYVAGTVAELKEKFGCPVVYLTGTVGGLMTSLRVPVKNEKGEELKDGTFEKADRFGRLVGRSAIRALEHAEAVTLTPFDTRRQALLLPVDNPIFKLAWQLGVLNRGIYVYGDDPFTEKREPGKDIASSLALESEVNLWKLGELGIAIIPGEIYPELVLDKVPDPADPNADFPDAPVEPAIYPNLKTKHRMLIGLGNDELGYLLPKRLWDENAPFTYGRKKAPYGEVNSLGVRAGPIVCEAFRRLAK